MKSNVGKSIVLVALAFPCAARATDLPKTCEAITALTQSVWSENPDLKQQRAYAVGTVATFTAPPGIDLNAMIDTYSKEEVRSRYKKFGCTEMQFISAKTGKIKVRIDLGPLDPQVTTDEKQAATSPAPEPERIEEPTAENLNSLLDLTIGFHRRELAVLLQLQTWYEVDPNHPEAVALQKEFCANQTADPSSRFWALVGMEPKDDARLKKAGMAIAEAGEKDSYIEKMNRNGDLVHKITTAQNELKGMGFACVR
jgi:hypothetical protein